MRPQLDKELLTAGFLAKIQDSREVLKLAGLDPDEAYPASEEVYELAYRTGLQTAELDDLVLELVNDRLSHGGTIAALVERLRKNLGILEGKIEP